MTKFKIAQFPEAFHPSDACGIFNLADRWRSANYKTIKTIAPAGSTNTKVQTPEPVGNAQ